MNHRAFSRGSLTVALLAALCAQCGDRGAGGEPQTLTRDALRAAFEDHYEKWKDHCHRTRFSSRIEDYLDSPDYRALVRLGPQALAFVVQKAQQDPEFDWIGWVWTGITRISGDPSVYPWAGESLVSIWKAGPWRFEKRFEKLWQRWKELRAKGETVLWTETTVLYPEIYSTRVQQQLTELGKTYKQLAALGITILPSVIQRLEEGDTDALYLLRRITREAPAVGPEAREPCLAWWEKNKQRWLIPWPEKEQ